MLIPVDSLEAMRSFQYYHLLFSVYVDIRLSNKSVNQWSSSPPLVQVHWSPWMDVQHFHSLHTFFSTGNNFYIYDYRHETRSGTCSTDKDLKVSNLPKPRRQEAQKQLCLLSFSLCIQQKFLNIGTGAERGVSYMLKIVRRLLGRKGVAGIKQIFDHCKRITIFTSKTI